MKTVTFTEFRKEASILLTEVEQGGTLIIIRHGRPIAEVVPYAGTSGRTPAWKEPGLRLRARDASLAAAILTERDEGE